jgi:hypothetical protein
MLGYGGNSRRHVTGKCQEGAHQEVGDRQQLPDAARAGDAQGDQKGDAEEEHSNSLPPRLLVSVETSR